MFYYLEGHLENARFNFKNDKKNVRCFFILTTLNVFLLVINIISSIHGSSSGLIGVGAMIMGTLYSLVSLMEFISDKNHSKKILQFYEEIKADQNIKEHYEEAKRAKEFYEKFYSKGGVDMSKDGKSSENYEQTM